MHGETQLNINFCPSLIAGVMWQHVCHFIRANDSQSTTATLINIIKDRFIHFLKMRSLCLFYIICLPRPIFPNQLSDNIIVKGVKKSINSSDLSFNSKKTLTNENTTELSRSTRYTKVSNTTENTRNTKEGLWNISATIASSDYETIKPNMIDESVSSIQSKNAIIRGRSISGRCSTTTTGKNQQRRDKKKSTAFGASCRLNPPLGDLGMVLVSQGLQWK